MKCIVVGNTVNEYLFGVVPEESGVTMLNVTPKTSKVHSLLSKDGFTCDTVIIDIDELENDGTPIKDVILDVVRLKTSNAVKTVYIVDSSNKIKSEKVAALTTIVAGHDALPPFWGTAAPVATPQVEAAPVVVPEPMPAPVPIPVPTPVVGTDEEENMDDLFASLTADDEPVVAPAVVTAPQVEPVPEQPVDDMDAMLSGLDEAPSTDADDMFAVLDAPVTPSDDLFPVAPVVLPQTEEPDIDDMFQNLMGEVDTTPAIAPTPAPAAVDDDLFSSILGEDTTPAMPQAAVPVPAAVPTPVEPTDPFAGMFDAPAPVSEATPSFPPMPAAPVEADPLGDMFAAPAQAPAAEPAPVDPFADLMGVAPVAPAMTPESVFGGAPAPVEQGGASGFSVQQDRHQIVAGTSAEPEEEKGGLFKPKKIRGLLPIDKNAMPNVIRRPFIITFWAPKGGTGKTTTAMNVCAYISSLTDLKTVLVDMDEFGDTGLSMNLEEQIAQADPNHHVPTIDDFIANIPNMQTFDDVEPWVIVERKTNMYIMLTSENSTNLQRPPIDQYERALDTMKQHFQVIAFDCGPFFDEYTKFALQSSDVVVLVTDQGFPTLAHVTQVINDFTRPESGIGKERLVLVVNKYRKKVGADIGQLTYWFADTVSAMHVIPAADDLFVQKLNRGELIIFSGMQQLVEPYKNITTDIFTRIKGLQDNVPGF